MDFIVTSTCSQVVLSVPAHLDLVLITEVSNWSDIDRRRSPSELHVDVLVRSCLTRLQGVANVCANRSWLLTSSVSSVEVCVSLVSRHCPLENLSHSTVNVSGSNDNLTNLRTDSVSIDCILVELCQVICRTIELVSILEFNLRHVNLIVSKNLVLDFIPSHLLVEGGVSIVTVQSECSVVSEVLSDLSWISSSYVFCYLNLHVGNSSNLVVNGIVQDNTYQRFATDDGTSLSSTVSLLLTVIVNSLRTQGVTVSSNSSVSTL